MANILQIKEQINALQARVKGLDGGQLYYEIWAFVPEMSDAYTLYYRGNNKNDKIYEQFCNELDALLGNTSIAKIRIVLKNNKKNFGDTEIILKSAYHSGRFLPPPIKSELPFSQQNEQQQGFGSSSPFEFLMTGLGGFDNTQLNGLGAIMNFRDKMIENQYAAKAREEKLEGIIAENAVLKSQIAAKESEIEQLKKENDSLEDQIGDLQDNIEEYEKLNPKRNMISGLLQNTLESVGLGLLKKTKYAGLLGLDENDSVSELKLAVSGVPQQPMPQVQVAEAGAENEFDIFKNLDSQKQAQFKQLLQMFKIDNELITICLQYIYNEYKNN
jgi:hypothetical protein